MDLVAVVAVVVVVLSSCGYSDVQPIIEPYFVQCDAFHQSGSRILTHPKRTHADFLWGGGNFVRAQ